MARLVAPFVIAATLLLAGCLETEPVSEEPDKVEKIANAVPAKEPLWYNPQTFPHPKFNYPTLTNPPTEITNPWLRPIPAAQLPTHISGFEHVAQVKGAPRGAGMSLIGSIAILPANPTYFVDISDPTKP